MEQVSAFAVYQQQNGSAKKAATKKSPKAKKQKKGNAQVQLPTDTPQKKRKISENSEPQPSTSKASKASKVASHVQMTNGTAASPNPNKKQKNKPSQTQRMNGVQVEQNESSSSPSHIGKTSSSVESGQKAFAHILSGTNIKKFMSENWEKAPLYIERTRASHYDFLNVSTTAIDEMLRTNHIEFTKNLDITSYENGIRETHNPDGRALPGTVWNFYQDGCSIRLINPQTFISSLHKFNATLQEYFHCLVGANIYLTPPNSQGFAPHYDDIEAFVLQIEGKKEWSLYPPRTEKEVLPRESSGNFQQNEIGEAPFTRVLSPGDLLYFPRGWIHQAKTVPNSHSLHITLSVYQKTSYADLFEELMKHTLKNAIENDITFRRGIPMDIYNNFGATYSACDPTAPRRAALKNTLTNMFRLLENYLDIDSAVDQMAIKYQHDALPPVLSSTEKLRTAFGTTPSLYGDGTIEMPDMDENTEVRLLRAHIIRLACIDGVHQLYYYADNSKEYHGNDLNFIEVEESTVDVIKLLIQLYPHYAKLQQLSPNLEEAMAVVYSLWERGLVMTKKPLQ